MDSASISNTDSIDLRPTMDRTENDGKHVVMKVIAIGVAPNVEAFRCNQLEQTQSDLDAGIDAQ
jgi:hypothetical protein